MVTLPRRALGKTGVEIGILGLGGEGVLRTYGREKEARQLINAAIDFGITYFESARAYSGSESYYGAALQERREQIFLASKSHARDKAGALAHLRETLASMKTNYLDLWQIHDVRTEDEMDEIFSPDGAIEAFVDAKKKGLVRFIGITGHHDASILRRCIQKFRFDTVLMPVNAAEPQHESFLSEVLPVAVSRQMGILGMKVFLRGLVQRIPWYSGMEPFLRFALCQPITAAVIGCDEVMQLAENVRLARSFQPLTDRESTEFIDAVAPFARQLMYYKPEH